MFNAPTSPISTTSPRITTLAVLAAALLTLVTARRALSAAVGNNDFAHLDAALLTVRDAEVKARLDVLNAYRAAVRATPKTHAYWHLLTEESYFVALDAESLSTLSDLYEELASGGLEGLEIADAYAADTHGALDANGLRPDGSKPGPVNVAAVEDDAASTQPPVAARPVDPPQPDTVYWHWTSNNILRASAQIGDGPSFKSFRVVGEAWCSKPGEWMYWARNGSMDPKPMKRDVALDCLVGSLSLAFDVPERPEPSEADQSLPVEPTKPLYRFGSLSD